MKINKLLWFALGAHLALACTQKDNFLVTDRYSGYAQGTTFHITIRDSSGAPDRGGAIDSILRAVNRSMSTYQENSLISRLNRGDTLPPDRLMITMLEQSREVYRRTKGAFDPTVGPLVNFWGFGPESRRKVDSSQVDALLARTGLPKLPQRSSSYVLPAGMKLDFNAIAQGYTVDLLAAYLEDQGIKNYLIEVGGEMSARGTNEEGQIWRVGIDKPTEEIDQQDRFQVILALDSAGLATSGNYRKFWVDTATGTRYAHTIDPRSGYPAMSQLLSASVIAPSSAQADAYATAFMVMGTEPALRFLDTTELPLEAYLISAGPDSSFKIDQTRGFEDMILNE